MMEVNDRLVPGLRAFCEACVDVVGMAMIYFRKLLG